MLFLASYSSPCLINLFTCDPYSQQSRVLNCGIWECLGRLSEAECYLKATYPQEITKNNTIKLSSYYNQNQNCNPIKFFKKITAWYLSSNKTMTNQNYSESSSVKPMSLDRPVSLSPYAGDPGCAAEVERCLSPCSVGLLPSFPLSECKRLSLGGTWCRSPQNVPYATRCSRNLVHWLLFWKRRGQPNS